MPCDSLTGLNILLIMLILSKKRLRCRPFLGAFLKPPVLLVVLTPPCLSKPRVSLLTIYPLFLSFTYRAATNLTYL